MYFNYVTDEGEQVTKLLCDCPDCDKQFLLIGIFSEDLIRGAASQVHGWTWSKNKFVRATDYCSIECSSCTCSHAKKAQLPRMR